jgi:hypothetical protein
MALVRHRFPTNRLTCGSRRLSSPEASLWVPNSVPKAVLQPAVRRNAPCFSDITGRPRLVRFTQSWRCGISCCQPFSTNACPRRSFRMLSKRARPFHSSSAWRGLWNERKNKPKYSGNFSSTTTAYTSLSLPGHIPKRPTVSPDGNVRTPK